MDLRTIVAVLRMNADLERMGVLTRHLAEIALARQPCCAVPDALRGHVRRMSQVACRLTAEACVVIEAGDDAGTAERMDAEDDEMDRLQVGVQTPARRGQWVRARPGDGHGADRPLLRATCRPRGVAGAAHGVSGGQGGPRPSTGFSRLTRRSVSALGNVGPCGRGYPRTTRNPTYRCGMSGAAASFEARKERERGNSVRTRNARLATLVASAKLVPARPRRWPGVAPNGNGRPGGVAAGRASGAGRAAGTVPAAAAVDGQAAASRRATLGARAGSLLDRTRRPRGPGRRRARTGCARRGRGGGGRWPRWRCCCRRGRRSRVGPSGGDGDGRPCSPLPPSLGFPSAVWAGGGELVGLTSIVGCSGGAFGLPPTAAPYPRR